MARAGWWPALLGALFAALGIAAWALAKHPAGASPWHLATGLSTQAAPSPLSSAPRALPPRYLHPHGSPEWLWRRMQQMLAVQRLPDARRLIQAAAATAPGFELVEAAHAALNTDRAGAPAESQLLEARLRNAAMQWRVPAQALPGQLWAWSAQNRHVIVVDSALARLYLFEQQAAATRSEPGPLRLVADLYVSLGKHGVAKVAEGDGRTPLGVYDITSKLPRRALDPFYGAGALTLDYPNAIDRHMGRTGSNIWLHGTPEGRFTRPPWDSDGCVVLSNPDLRRLFQTVDIRSTPVILSAGVQWVQARDRHAQREAFMQVFDAWRTARTRGDVAAFERHYSQGARQAWPTPRAGRVEIKDLSLLHWQDAQEVVVATFGEVPWGRRQGPMRRQYWVKDNVGWRIFSEGTLK